MKILSLSVNNLKRKLRITWEDGSMGIIHYEELEKHYPGIEGTRE